MGSGGNKPTPNYMPKNKELVSKQSKESGLSYAEIADLQRRYGERDSAFDYSEAELKSLRSIRGFENDETRLSSFLVDAELYKTNKKITEEKKSQEDQKKTALAEASNLSAYSMQRKKRLEMGGRAATIKAPADITTPVLTTAKKRNTLIGT